MVFDPGWDMPRVNWQQQGSFETGEIPLAFEPDAGPLVCLPPVNVHWLPLILGCLDQLRNPSTWITSTDAQLNTALDRANRLMQMIGERAVCFTYQLRFTSSCVLQYSLDAGATWADVAGWDANFGPCVQAAIPGPVPGNPGGNTPDQQGCNIAGYLATEIIKLSITDAVSAFNSGAQQLGYAQDILATIGYAFPLTTIALEAFAVLYGEYTLANIADFTDASTDPALWGLVTCAVYNAIHSVGYITEGNLAAVISNVCGITYTHTNVIAAICNWIGNIGLANLQAIQNVGVLDSVDCSACGGPSGWCKQWDFTATNGPFNIPSGAPGAWGSTVGWYGLGPGGAHDLRVETDPFTARTITYLEFHYSVAGTSDMTSGVRLRKAGSTVMHWDLPQTPGSYTFIASGLSISADAIWFGGDSDTSQIFTFGKVKGTGTNPFGTSNC